MDPVARVLVEIEEILYEILSYLPARDLHRLSSVCRTWERIAKRILYKRSCLFALDFSTLTFTGFCCKHTEASTSTQETRRINILSQSDCQLCFVKKTVTEMQSQWQQAPKVVILVCKSVKANCHDFSCTSKAVYDEFKKCLPNDCIVLMLRSAMCCRLVDLNFVFRTEALLLFSSRSNCIKLLTWTSLKSVKSKTTLLTSIKESFLRRTDLKMLLFFYDISNCHVGRWIKSKLIPFLKKELEANSSVVIVGCAIHDHSGMVHSKSCSNSLISLVGNQLQGQNITEKSSVDGGQFLSLAVCGNSVTSVSMLADSSVTSVNELSTKLKLLKKSCESKTFTHTNSFGMIVSCIDRMHDSVWYEDFERTDEHVELNALQKEFPNLPILTVHSFGEVGCDANLLGLNSKESLTTHAGASVFSVVHFGD